MAPATRKPQDYTLRVTAGPSYDLTTHVQVPINSSKLTHISSEGMDMDLNVRIQDYQRGLPRNSPCTSSYFDKEPHRYNKDQYSISIRFTPKAPPTSQHGNGKSMADGTATKDGPVKKQVKGEEEEVQQGIPSSDLQFGNDFDHPIRAYLPPGVNTAMNIVKWWIDPGLEGDAYADEPFLYGPALSSFNAVRVGRGGEHDDDDDDGVGLWVEEGGSSTCSSDGGSDREDGEDDEDEDDASSGGVDGQGSAGAGAGAEQKNETEKSPEAHPQDTGQGQGAGAGQQHPKTNNSKPSTRTRTRTRTHTSGKHWRDEVLKGSGVGDDPKKRQKWALKEDSKKKWVWEYGRTYAVDFYNPYIDFGRCELKLPGFGVNVLRYWDGETGLRYVLRNRLTKKPYLVILFTLYPNDMVNEDGTLKPEALKATARASGGGREKTDTDGAKAADADAGIDEAAKQEGEDGFRRDKALDEAREKLGVKIGEGPKERAGGHGDDVD
ncbi:hypothetical protein QBC45DRAFT_441695 [Copromyces sp. CBS 386.78]|nr:hypothetical protein QBC45DRAFT_441695 [Copromyces sp. CBS 386.78]